MTCRLVVRSDGSRAIMCIRFEPRPFVGPELVAPHPASPWKVGANVKHRHYGFGRIMARNAEGVRVAFASGHSATFVLSLVANGMEVLP